MPTEKSKIPPIPDSAMKRVEDWLVNGEELLLVARPYRWRMTAAASGQAIMGLALCAIGLTGVQVMLAPMTDRNPFPTPMFPAMRILFLALALICVMVFLLGLFTAYSPVWEYRNVHRYIYAITNQRLILIQPDYFRDVVHCYSRHEMTQLNIRKWRMGYDDLLFASQTAGRGTMQIGFLGIPDVEDVRRLILETFDFDEGHFQKSQRPH